MSRIEATLSPLAWDGHRVRVYPDNDTLIIDSQTVVVNSSRRFTLNDGGRILDGFWANFIDQRLVCAVQLESMRIFTLDGRSFHVALPFKIRAAWPLNNGVLIESMTSSLHFLGQPLENVVDIAAMSSTESIKLCSPSTHFIVSFDSDSAEYILSTFHNTKGTVVIVSHCKLKTLSKVPAEQVFMSTDCNGAAVLCLMDPSLQRLDLFNISLSSSNVYMISHFWFIKAVSAVAIDAIVSGRDERCLDIVAVNPDYTVSLWSGNLFRCTVALPGFDNNHIVSVSDATDQQFTVSFADNQSFRAKISFPLQHALTQACFGALCCGYVPFDKLYSLFCDLNALKECFPINNDWDVFSNCIKATLSPDNVPSLPRTSSWHALLDSEYHQRISSSVCFSFLDAPEVPSRASSQGMTVTDLRAFAIPILHSLHLLYEVYKLDALMVCYVQQLAHLLIGIAETCGRHEHVHHYVRDFGSLYSPGRQETSIDKEAPVDLLGYMYSCINASGVVPELPYFPVVIKSPFKNGLRLCRVYQLLAAQDREEFHMDDESESEKAITREQRIVSMMVDEGICKSDLDALPFGIALPLRGALRACRQQPPDDWPELAYELIGREDLCPSAWFSSPCQEPAEDDLDGTLFVTNRSTFRFGNDHRVLEVRRLLRSDTVLRLKMPEWHEIADQDVVVAQQKRLVELALRALSLPFGRAMFTLGSIEPVVTEPISIPNLILNGCTVPKNINVDLDMTALPESFTKWPEFHNGFASGLRIVPRRGQSTVARTWIVYNRPQEPTYTHAGLLLALGLHGHLDGLARSDLYWYLSKKHNPTTIALLLGVAFSHRGTMNASVSKTLCLHIPALLPAGFDDMEIPLLVQTSAVLGLGLLYQGTSNRLMAEVMIGELGRRLSSLGRSCENREGYALAVGLALGLITLGRGENSIGLTDLHLEDNLSQFINGGRHDPVAREKVSESSKSSLIREGNVINVDVASSGATLALGLMFLRTNNAAVAARLHIPDTKFALESVRPDFLMLRVISRSLILWDGIAPTEAWIQSLIPDIMRRHGLDEGETSSEDDPSDLEYLRQSFCNVISGACAALGLRFAGTANAAACCVISRYVQWFQSLRRGVRRVERNTADNCLSACVLALACVMSGTGNLATFSLLRSLRTHPDADSSYGFSVALHMAIGFLFLGGGRYSLSTRPEATAALVVALFPRFPIHTDDNRYHLQAFRHLYVLAAEPRYLETRDIDTGLPCFVPLQIKTSTSDKLHDLTAPCLLPPFDSIVSLQVAGPRFWQIQFHFQSDCSHAKILRDRGILYVKRRTGHLHYRQDPFGRRGVLSRSFPCMVAATNRKTRLETEMHRQEFVKSFAADSVLVEFAKNFCVEGIPMGTFASAVLYECLTRETPEMLPVYMAIYEIVVDLMRQPNSLGIYQLKLLVKYCQTSNVPPLLQPEFISFVSYRLHDFFSSTFFQQSLSSYIVSGLRNLPTGIGSCLATRQKLFSMFMAFYDIPSAPIIAGIVPSLTAESIMIPQLLECFRRNNVSSNPSSFCLRHLDSAIQSFYRNG
uniref:Uncharacterized protein n=1 Tax=Spongospora subterranea TaxID=70186 RepID=A0A0H5RAJ9_9EUKA|eukprot:CRZ11098.1 hypothetical protein [Spongospora subterranea]